MTTPFNKTLRAVAASAMVAWAGMTSASAIIVNFSSLDNASIDFVGTGNAFSFPSTEAGGFDFVLQGSGLLGKIDGTFTIGAITTTGPLQEAPVSDVGGALSIFDGVNTFNASLDWVSISTLGTIGGANAGGVVNLSGITYAGTNPILLGLSQGNMGIATLTFQFTVPTSLTTLTADGSTTSTSYSGSISNVPDGGSILALLGMTLIGVEGLRRKLLA